MEIREVRVEFKKTVSDGNYGNETYSVVFTSTLDEPTDEAQEIAFHLAELAHAEVMAHLKRSTSEGVRSALETREEREARWAHERDDVARAAAPPRYPLEQAPSDEPLEGSGEMPVSDRTPP